MQFLVTAYDGRDDGALQRRLEVRDAHLESAEKMYREKKLLYAAAILDEKDKMIGSVMIVDFPSKEAVQEQWLVHEPYVVNEAWKEIRIEPCKVPFFCIN